MNPNSVRKFVAALALLLGAGGSPVIAQTAPASSSGTPSTVKMEKMVVTGSRLGAVEGESDIPIITIDAKLIQQTPVVEVADFVKGLPSFTGAGNINDTLTNGGAGARNIDLRGLGSAYTLILINGRPMASADTDVVVDVNQIPVSAIDHVEVLTSGASAIYGTSAIGGVVNVITRTGQNGGEFTAYYGNARGTSLARRQFGFSFNGSNEKLDVLVGAQYLRQNGISSYEFPWSSVPGPTSNIFPYRMSMPNSLFTPGATGNSNMVVKWKPGEGGRRDAATPTDFRTYQGTLPNLENPDAGGDQFPFYLYTPLLRPEERYNAYAFVTYQLNEKVKIFGDVMYRYAFSHNQLAPAAVPVPALGAIVIPPTNYYNNKIFGASAPNITAGGWRLIGLGARLDEAEVNGFWGNAGIEGKVGDWNWKFATLFSQEMRADKSGNSGDLPTLNSLLALTTPDAFNPFTSKLETNASSWDQIRRDAFLHNRSRLANFLWQTDGKIADLESGPVRLSVAAEWNRISAYSKPDALTKSGPLGFNGTPNDTVGSRRQWGLSAETEIPMLKQLTGRFALRHDDYSDFGGVTVGQASFRYQPTSEVLLRGSWGQGFLAPSILSLYEGPQVTNPLLLDPTAKKPSGGWGDDSQISLRRIGNPDLGPEHARMYNLGIVYSPKAVKGLTFSLDYFDVDQTDVVSSADDYARIIAVRFWESLGSSDAARDAAARNPTTLAAAVNTIKQQTGVTVLWEPDGGPSALGGLSQSFIAMENVGRVNLAGQKTHGFDLNANYSWDTQTIGTMNLGLTATRTMSFQYQALKGEPFLELAGWHSASFEGVWPKWRYNVSYSWNWKEYGLNATYRHIDSVKLQSGVDSVYNRDYLPAWNTWDIQFSYRVPWTKTDLAVGVENVGGKAPPLTEFAINNNVPAGAYDVKGRFWYVRASQKF